MLLQDIQREKNDSKDHKVKQDLLQSVSGFVRGPAQVYFKAKFGLVGGTLSAVGFIAISAIANHIGFTAQRRNLLNTYRDELALVLHKDRDALNERDLLNYVAQPDNAKSPIVADFDILKKNERATQTKSLIKNILISASVFMFAAVSAFAAAPASAAAVAALGAAEAGFALSMMGYVVIGAITKAIDILSENVLEKWQSTQPVTGFGFTRKIQGEMARERVGPEKLFEYAIHVHPQWSAAIRNNLNEDYATLSYEKKLAVIEKLGVANEINRIAEDLNHGKIRPSELPFLLAGMDSASTQFASYRKPAEAVTPITGAQESVLQKQAAVANTPGAQVRDAVIQGQAHERASLAAALG